MFYDIQTFNYVQKKINTEKYIFKNSTIYFDRIYYNINIISSLYLVQILVLE